MIIAFTGIACGQNAKVKTITIINGDTTINELEPGEKDLSGIEKQITMVISEDADHSGKKVITKKIIVNDETSSPNDAFAYAYCSGDKDQDMEITTDDNGHETKIVITKSNDDGTGNHDKKTIVKRSPNRNSEKIAKEKLNINITVNKTTAKLDIETADKEPVNINILDENGKQVFYDSSRSGGKYSKEISLEKKGTYFLNIIQNKKLTTEKIEIK